LAQRVKAFITVEINLGQIHLEVTRAAAGQAACHLVGHHGGAIISPDKVLAAIKEVV
jgi:2-oxoglutarate ferredoxin oxidoreductase subunit alpha